MENENQLLSTFGLSYEQSQILFSIENLLVEADIGPTSLIANCIAHDICKSYWLDKWKEGIGDYFASLDSSREFEFLSEKSIIKYLQNDIKNNNNHTWINIIALECLTFTAYTPLGDEKADSYNHVSYDKQAAYKTIVHIFCDNNILSLKRIETLDKTYFKMYEKISGKTKDMIIKGAIVVVAALGMGLLASLLAPAIAVGLFGGAFAELHGAALVSACLALIGGGAIAAGGAGMAGGVAVIVGGGALLGLGIGGAAVATKEIIANSPDFTLTQCAKIETILKEIILAENKDVVIAQSIISNFKKQILEMKNKLAELELENEKNKDKIKLIKKTIQYMTNTYNDMQNNDDEKEVRV